jgi:hypothetical protein
MANRKSFVFYRSYYEAIEKLPIKKQLTAYKTLLQYGLDGTEYKSKEPAVNMIMSLIKPNIDTNIKKYEVSVENGKKGRKPKKKITEQDEVPNSLHKKNTIITITRREV